MKRFELLALLLIPAIPMAQQRLEGRATRDPARQRLYLPAGEYVRRLCPGFEMLMADIYWLRAVQYYGSQRAFVGEPDFSLLRPLIEIATTLDSRLEQAYLFGSIFLSEPPPNGAGDPASGIAILEQGIRKNPASWRLQYYLGLTRHFYLRESRKASEILVAAADLPHAPFWLRTLAARLATTGGDHATSRLMWKAMAQSEEGHIKQNALFHLRQLDVFEAVDAVQRMVETFKAHHGRLPRDLGELQSAGMLKSIPTDPNGLAVQYDAEKGIVTLPRESAYRLR